MTGDDAKALISRIADEIWNEGALGITIYRLDGGKIAEAWEELDMLGMWRQLGVIELPGHEPGSA